MSVEMSSERVCYVQCNFCNTILAVSVPSSSWLSIVTVRCGHCANLLSVNMGGLMLHSALHLQDFQKQQSIAMSEGGSSSKCNMFHPQPQPDQPQPQQQPKMPPIRPPEKRQRVPSAYNRFIKEEIQRIKASNPEITHREAFSAAAKNWAHLPHIHFGVNKMSHADHAAA